MVTSVDSHGWPSYVKKSCQELQKDSRKQQVTEWQLNFNSTKCKLILIGNMLIYFYILKLLKQLFCSECNFTLFLYHPWQPNHCWLHLMVPELTNSLNNLLQKFKKISDMSDVLSNYSIINNLTRIINDIMACLSPKNKVMILELIFLFISNIGCVYNVSSTTITVFSRLYQGFFPQALCTASYPYVRNTLCVFLLPCVYIEMCKDGEKDWIH